MSFNDDNKKNHQKYKTSKPIRYTIKPNAQSLIILKTLPNAVCTINKEIDEPLSNSSFKIFADHEGIIRFYVRFDPMSDEAISKVIIKCDTDDNILYQPLEFRSSSYPRDDAPSPTIEDIRSQEGVKIRPALSDEESLNLSDEELLRRGYPHRPDFKKSPDAFSKWKKIVSITMTMIVPQTVINYGISHRPDDIFEEFYDSARTWSGYVLRDRDSRDPSKFRRYAAVSGKWNVPSVQSETGNTVHSSFWVGLDGWQHSDLVQAGTAHNVVEFRRPNGITTIMDYYVWSQFLPQQQNELRVTNFVVSPGDEIQVDVQISDSLSNTPDLTGSHAHFVINNLTTRQFTPIMTPRGNTIVNGFEAVWVMEAPTVLGFVSDLSNYNTATMNHADAYFTDDPIPTGPSGWVSYLGGNYLKVSMVNGSNILSTVDTIFSPSREPHMRFTYHAPH